MGSLDQFVREIRRFDRRKEVTKQLRTEIRKPIPAVRKSIKARALDVLPKGGGLNVWVSKARITAKIKLSGRSAGVSLKGGRNSTGARSDLRRIDAGRVRAPSWGHRTKASWHSQTVTEGFFTRPVTETRAWQAACIRAINNALKTIRRG